MLPWLVASAFAGQLYINGVFVDPATIPGVEIKGATLTFDAQGNIKVNAPGYKIEVQGNPTPPPAPTGTPAPQTTTAPVAPRPIAPPPNNNGVVSARWWLVTEDNASVGHTIDVMVNGQVVRTVGSGMPQQILDVGKWLKPGANEVKIRANSVNASGGNFYVYIGTGSDQSGTVVMENPLVQFGVANTRQGQYERDYQLDVDR